ncbi:probable enoyl-CoA hydratase echA8 isoform X2 [Toxorhynchites rutilus septentrionalis]|uniref:probable enoyl-CoA hydratase echA8 isoform X2 n=1 Tax=Toxorhynchites rutilus septentrionalis TaxID=329112 RepID=UPI002479935A|nr:probable enoyl-CoA hydratase echA8 isoform X2 [Toxorhynchites rutilus septentrionalis]
MWLIVRTALRSSGIFRGVLGQRHCSTVESDQDAKEEPPVQVEKIANITMIGLNRPQVRNAIDSETGKQLTAAIEEFEQDTTADVGVLHGIGGSFCAGYDLSELANPDVNPQSIILQRSGVMGPTRRNFTKPVICAISGYCVAGGMELALMCDLRVMEDQAVLGFYNRRFGVPLVDGGTVRLPALIGISRAMDLVLTGRAVHAKEALHIGLVNRVVAVGTGLGQAYNLAMSIAKFPQACLRHDRNSMFNSAFQATSLRDAMEFEVLTAGEDLLNEAVQGANKFMSGVGKHGKFTNLKEKIIPDWEKEVIEHEIKTGRKLKVDGKEK